MQTFICTGTFTLDVSGEDVTISGSIDSSASYPVWVRPEYKAGSIVVYQGKPYIALRDTAYAPTTSAWAPYIPN